MGTVRCLSFVLFLVAIQTAIACAQPATAQVEYQPLASNVQRIVVAFDSLGFPLSNATLQSIRAASMEKDAESIQRALDVDVVGIISISPEERVSVKRGVGKAVLQQAGYTPVLFKVINESTSTAELNVRSPNAGAVFAGMHKLSMQRQQQLQFLEQQNEDGEGRFLAVEVHRKPPMTDRLSGLKVEYVIVLLASSESGKREAILEFDIGDDTADLEHRNSLPVLFDIKPAVPVKLAIKDHDGSPTMARLEFRDSHERVYPLQAKRLAPDFFFQAHVYRADEENVILPPGKFNVQFSRGPEYRVRKTEIDVRPDRENHLAIKLDRWYDAAEHGFFSGDHHIHAAGCAHYTHPTEGVTPSDMFRQVQGEGLNVGCVLTWGPCFEFQRQYFNESAIAFGTKDTLLKYDLEISGFGSQALGHVCLLNLKDQTYPESAGTKTKGWPTWTTPVMRWAKEQGGYTGYAHSASGLQINPRSASARLLKRFDADADGSLSMSEVEDAFLPMDSSKIDSDRDARISMDELVTAHESAAEQLPNHAIPEMSGVGAMEICVSTVAGVCDFISAMDTRRIQEWNTWYHLLNCGFPLKVSGETDFPCMSSRRVGKGRVYVQLGKNAKLDFASWCEALAKGRSYVSDGYAHIAALTVNDKSPGVGEVQLDGPKVVTVSAEVAFAPETPEAVAYGTADSNLGRAVIGDTVILHRDRTESWVKGGTREVEIIVNGQPVAKETVPADGEIHAFTKQIKIDRSSWVAIRHFPQLHSNPVNVIVAGEPIRASRRSARWCIEMTELLWVNREKNIAADERPAARQAFDHALATLREIESESP